MPLIDPGKSYNHLVKYLSSEVWYNGDGSFTYVPIDEEELRGVKSSLDQLLEGTNFLEDLDEDGLRMMMNYLSNAIQLYSSMSNPFNPHRSHWRQEATYKNH